MTLHCVKNVELREVSMEAHFHPTSKKNPKIHALINLNDDIV